MKRYKNESGEVFEITFGADTHQVKNFETGEIQNLDDKQLISFVASCERTWFTEKEIIFFVVTAPISVPIFAIFFLVYYVPSRLYLLFLMRRQKSETKC